MKSNRNERIRYRYGICLNESCTKAQTKEVQQIAVRNDFVCPECGKMLKECPPPAASNKGKYATVAAIVVVLLGGGIGGYFMTQKDAQEPLPETELTVQADPATDEAEPLDTMPAAAPAPEVPAAEPEKAVKEEPAKPAQQVAGNRKDLGYAVYKGRLKNGLPNDENGTMTYKEKHRIDSRDPQKRMAEAGDYIIGEFVDGKLVQGVWYNAQNTVKGSIIIGR